MYNSVIYKKLLSKHCK